MLKKFIGDKYDYSKVKYEKLNKDVCIICPEHGEFWQTPNAHLRGGCPKCSFNKMGKNKTLTIEQFIEKARKVHGNKYDYSKVEYKGNRYKVCIICPEHGEFWQTPNNHLNGNGCKKCNIEKISKNKTLTTEQFIKKAKLIHKNKYIYSKTKYINNNTKVCIICPEHGEFWQIPMSHIDNKSSCPKCINNQRYTTEEFIKRAKEVHR